ncbi:hypothetical protein [Asticcacaulis solisilvae]|uniref:hypothetical protein n=1 Tax=Asticcacaulis solisilvae TaxID=1217274 RepID=UPI003FD7FBC1
MSDTEKLLKRAEGMAGLRRGLMVVNALTYVMWIGSTGLQHVDTGLAPQTLNLIGLAAWPVWLASLLGILWTMRHLAKHRDIAGLVDDERTVGLTKRSFQAGYWVLLLAVAGLYTASFFVPIDVRMAAPILLALGVAAPSLTYALLYRS